MRVLSLIGLLFCFAFFPVFSVAGASNDQEIGYASVFDKKGVVLGFSHDSVRLFDLALPATQCDSHERFVCIRSKVFVFSIPKDFGKLSNWSHEGARYQVLENSEGAFLDKHVLPYKIIRQQWNGLSTDYAYSEEFGVFAIKAKNGNQLILTGSCGIAAISNKSGCMTIGPSVSP